MNKLRKFQINPKSLLNTALHLFKSKNIKTAVVEGVCDQRFLSQWKLPINSPIRFDGYNGKGLVESVYKNSQLKPYVDYDFLYFFADIDYDIIVGNPLCDHSKFIYNAYCFENTSLVYNDLETYLINTMAFGKVLANYDLDAEQAVRIKQSIQKISRVIGSFRAADILIQRSEQLSASILNGLEIREFFNPKELSFDIQKFKKSIPKWSNKPHYVDDLIQKAEQLTTIHSSDWSLSRGHDLTEMIALYVESIGNYGVKADRIELLLRLACELEEFQNSPMWKRILKHA